MVRKLAEKMVKNLKVNVSSFAADVSMVGCRLVKRRIRCWPISLRKNFKRRPP